MPFVVNAAVPMIEKKVAHNFQDVAFSTPAPLTATLHRTHGIDQCCCVRPVLVLRDPLEKEGRSCEFFTMMRHPVSRLVSAFYFCPDDDRLDRPAKVRRFPGLPRAAEFAVDADRFRPIFAVSAVRVASLPCAVEKHWLLGDRYM